MDRVDIPFYYELGAVLRPIVAFDKTSPKTQVWLAAWRLKATVLDLIEAGLVVTRNPAEKLLRAIEDVDAWTGEDLQAEMEWKYERVIGALASAARDLEAVALAELQTLPAYSVGKKGAYESRSLVENADTHLLPATRKKLGESVLRDVRESGRCLAFDSPTASGFHMMRAVERVAREYWIVCCVPDDDAKTKRMTLGDYVSRLRQSTDAHPKEVVELLDQVRDTHRNLLLHANADNFLEPEDAFTLFHIGLTVIMAMAEKLSAAPAPTVLARGFALSGGFSPFSLAVPGLDELPASDGDTPAPAPTP